MALSETGLFKGISAHLDEQVPASFWYEKKESELHGVTENIIYWENEKKYIHLINEAGEFYETKEYQKSATKFKKAFKLKEKHFNRNRYNAACSFALSDDIESAFIQLFILANNSSNYLEIERLISDTDLENLHEEQRWNELIAIVKLKE